MKSVFAKLMEKNPVESSHIAFRAGGDGVPILTRASGQSTKGYQDMGLPTTNKTVLGSVRMGDQDGNAPGSAILPNDIFYTPGQPDREYPERYFSNVGNNVFQPTNDDSATIALLRRLGDQKFKAEANAPFEEYRAQQRQVKDLEEASRNASLSDSGLSREIIRNIAAQRRQQNEDDYLRKMLDAGATPEAARKEIEDMRNANAIQEAKKVDDRQYQAKMLIQRMAMARGITPMVQEPLNQSSSIDNPQRSQAMSQAMGMPGEGFGTSPLDMNRQFLTPDFYKKFLRRSNISQEASDEATAFSNMLTGAGNEDQLKNLQSGYSMATMKGQERQAQIEMAAESLASRLEALRQRGNKIKLKLLPTVFAKQTLDFLYKIKQKEVGDKVLFSAESIQDMNPLQVLLAINNSIQENPNGQKVAKTEFAKYNFGNAGKPSDTLLTDLKKVAYALNKNEFIIRIPLASAMVPLENIKPSYIITAIEDFKTNNSPELRQAIERGRLMFRDEMKEIGGSEIPTASGPAPVIPRPARNTSRKNKKQPVNPISQVPIPGAPGPESPAQTAASDNYDNMTLKELKAEAKKQGKRQSGNREQIIQRLRE